MNDTTLEAQIIDWLTYKYYYRWVSAFKVVHHFWVPMHQAAATLDDMAARGVLERRPGGNCWNLPIYRLHEEGTDGNS